MPNARNEKLRLRLHMILKREQELLRTCSLVAGVDEAGRGPLAGPVVCAAAQHGPDFPKEDDIPWLMEIYDSKQLTEKKREAIFARLMSKDSPLQISVALAGPEEIDEINILAATHRAMRTAVLNLPKPPGFVLVDGTAIPKLDIPQEKIIKGDSLCLVIAAASIAAKVTRDHIMLEYEEKYPGYGFAKHKGYGTKEHLEAISRLGRSPVHRRTFFVAGLDPERDRKAKAGENGGGHCGKRAPKKGLPDSPAQLSLFQE